MKMTGTFPPDVVVVDSDSLLFVRVQKGRRSAAISAARRYSLPPDTFTAGVITPALGNAESFRAAVRRMKADHGRVDRISVLLPDSWFRMNLLEVADLPQKRSDADQVVRWSLKRTLPIKPEELRTTWSVIDQSGSGASVFVLAALETGLASLEKAFADEGLQVVLIEPVGLNLWNAIVVREKPTEQDRLFLYVREKDFTTAVFRGTTPLFVRSRNLSGERTLTQELKISAAYLKNSLQNAKISQCYLAGGRIDPAIATAVSEEFEAPATRIHITDYVESSIAELPLLEAELTACTGVFTA